MNAFNGMITEKMAPWINLRVLHKSIRTEVHDHVVGKCGEWGHNTDQCCLLEVGTSMNVMRFA
jgi:hypothetical protein